MDCEKSKEYMLKYIEESITGKEMFELKKHIKECRECKEEFDVYSEISGEINDIDFESTENNDVVSEKFEIDVMKKISGIEFKTEKILIFLTGIISLCVAFAIFIEVCQNIVFFDKNIFDSAIENSTGFFEKISLVMKLNIASVLQFISEFFWNMRYFSLFMIFFVMIGKVFYDVAQRNRNN